MTTVQSYFAVLGADHNLYDAGIDLKIKLIRYSYASTFSSFSTWKYLWALVSEGSPDEGSLVFNPVFVDFSGNMNQLTDFGFSQNSPNKGAGRGNIGFKGSDGIVRPVAPVLRSTKHHENTFCIPDFD